MNNEQNELSRARTPSTVGCEYVHTLKCLDVWWGLKGTKHKSKTVKKNLHYSVSVSLWICLFLLCVERKSSIWSGQ